MVVTIHYYASTYLTDTDSSVSKLGQDYFLRTPVKSVLKLDPKLTYSSIPDLEVEIPLPVTLKIDNQGFHIQFQRSVRLPKTFLRSEESYNYARTICGAHRVCQIMAYFRLRCPEIPQ